MQFVSFLRASCSHKPMLKSLYQTVLFWCQILVLISVLSFTIFYAAKVKPNSWGRSQNWGCSIWKGRACSAFPSSHKRIAQLDPESVCLKKCCEVSVFKWGFSRKDTLRAQIFLLIPTSIASSVNKHSSFQAEFGFKEKKSMRKDPGGYCA